MEASRQIIIIPTLHFSLSAYCSVLLPVFYYFGSVLKGQWRLQLHVSKSSGDKELNTKQPRDRFKLKNIELLKRKR